MNNRTEIEQIFQVEEIIIYLCIIVIIIDTIIVFFSSLLFILINIQSRLLMLLAIRDSRFLAANTHLISVSFHLYIVSLRFSSVGLIIYEMFKQEVRSYLKYFSLSTFYQAN